MTAVQAPARVALASADPARSGWDPVSWATIVVVVLFGCSQRYVIGAFGAAGSPAALGSLVAAAWWLIAVGSAAVPGLGRQPARPLLLLFWAAGLSGYAAAWSRSLSATEGHAADRTLLQWLGYGGLALLIADGVGSRARLDVLVGRLLGAATALAVAGIGQFVTGVDPARLLLLPLHWNNAEGLGAQGFRRGGLLRIAATTLHPIEFGVVLAALLPLAVVNALAGLHKPRWRRWSPPLLIGAAIPLAISRAAVIGLAVGMVWLIGALTSSARLRLGAAAIAAATLSILSWPRLLDALGKAFWGIGSDPSITARTSDYRYLDRFVAGRPLTGRGIGTFVPKLYDYLDNQYLLTLIEGGLVAVIALVSLLLGALWLARSAGRRATDPSTAMLARALGASVAVHIVTFAAYDGLTFPTAATSLFLVIGLLGALWRLTPPPVGAS